MSLLLAFHISDGMVAQVNSLTLAATAMASAPLPRTRTDNMQPIKDICLAAV